jgi:TPR repeat protein
MYKMGMILLKGLLGQAKNPREGISWLKRAADRADAENPHALHELILYIAGGSPKDAARLYHCTALKGSRLVPPPSSCPISQHTALLWLRTDGPSSGS